MTKAGTPSRPFPAQAIFSLEARPTDADGAPSLPATLVTPALSELRSYTAVYLERYGIIDAPHGQTIAVRGAHGSGKTHALGYLIHEVKHGEIPRGSRVEQVLQLYAKAEEPGLVGIYQSLMAQVSVTRLRDLGLRFSAEVAGDAIAGSKRGDELVADLREKLRAQPRLVTTMLRDYFIDESEVLDRRDTEIGRLTGESSDFINAFSWLDSELGDLAYRWFVGGQLDSGQLRKLGVTQVIGTAEMAKFGLQLLAGLCRRSQAALIVLIDQYEKLVLDAGGKLERAAAGIVHTLAEVMPREDAMLVLAGNEEAWEALPADLKQRFGYRVVECRGLDLGEAAELVNLYLRPHEPVVDRELTDDDLHPFTLDGLGVLHLYSGGNARQLLELCAAAYDATLAGDVPVIDRDAARVAADAVGVERVDPVTAREAVRRVAEGRGYAMAFSQAASDGGAAPLRLSLDGRDRLRVVIGQSAHYYDEVLDAAQYVDMVEDLRRDAPGVRLVLLVLGYESPEVHETLTRAGIDVVRYHPRTFAKAFGALIDGLRNVSEASAGFTDGLVVEQIEQIRRTLDVLISDRQVDARGLAAKATVVEEHHESELLAKRWQQAADDWVGERRRLEDRIRDGRYLRRAGQLEEIERLRAHAEHDRTGRQRVIVAAVLAAVLTGIVATYFSLKPSFYDSFAAQRVSYPWSFPLAVLAWTVVALSAIRAYLTALSSGIWSLRDQVLRSRIQRELATPVSSVEDLRRLAYRARSSRSSVNGFLGHANPQVRYAAAVAAEGPEVGHLVDAIPGERCALVREAFAKRVGEEPAVAVDALPQVAASDAREAVYILEGLLRRQIDPPAVGIPGGPLDTLTAMHVLKARAPAVRVLIGPGLLGSEIAADVDAAIAGGLPLSSRELLAALSGDVIRHAARSVSPFEVAGLGGFDELGVIDDVDRAFLVLSQLLFLSELGLLLHLG